MEEEEEGGAGGYSQFQSDSSGPATITSAVIMNTLFFLFSLKQKSQKEEEIKKSQPEEWGWPLKRLLRCFITPPAAPSSGGPWPGWCWSVVRSANDSSQAAGAPLLFLTTDPAGLASDSTPQVCRASRRPRVPSAAAVVRVNPATQAAAQSPALPSPPGA